MWKILKFTAFNIILKQNDILKKVINFIYIHWLLLILVNKWTDSLHPYYRYILSVYFSEENTWSVENLKSYLKWAIMINPYGQLDPKIFRFTNPHSDHEWFDLSLSWAVVSFFQRMDACRTKLMLHVNHLYKIKFYHFHDADCCNTTLDRLLDGDHDKGL